MTAVAHDFDARFRAAMQTHRSGPERAVRTAAPNPVDWQPENLTEALVRKTVFNRDLKDQWLLSNGYYTENLNRWEKYFPSEQVFVGFHDDLQQNPQQFLEEICKFLQVKGSFDDQTRQLEIRYNQKPIQLAIHSDIEAILSNIYLEELQLLAGRFGGVTSNWLNRAQSVLEHTS